MRLKRGKKIAKGWGRFWDQRALTERSECVNREMRVSPEVRVSREVEE